MSIGSAQTLLPPVHPQRAEQNEPDPKAVFMQQWRVYEICCLGNRPEQVRSAINQAKVHD